MSTIVESACAFAIKAHGSQRYEKLPYGQHLFDVAATLQTFGITDKGILAAAWLHDVLDKTDVERDDLEERFGPEIANVVQALTLKPGKNRSARNRKTYAQIRPLRDARLVKLADRIANVQYCWARKNRRLFTYHKEYRTFRKGLMPTIPVGVEKRMWGKLDKLLGWEEG